MRRPRITIARAMGWTAVVAIDAALIRAFLGPGEMFEGAVFLFFALQLAAWRLARAGGRRRRFWIGFVGAGVGVVAALVWAEADPRSPPAVLLSRSSAATVDAVDDVGPDWLVDWVDEHAHLGLAVAYFIPELACCLLGGLVVALGPPLPARRPAGPGPRPPG